MLVPVKVTRAWVESQDCFSTSSELIDIRLGCFALVHKWPCFPRLPRSSLKWGLKRMYRRGLRQAGSGTITRRMNLITSGLINVRFSKEEKDKKAKGQ